MHKKKKIFLPLFISGIFLLTVPGNLFAGVKEIASSSVVRIDVNSFSFSYSDPWLPPSLNNSSGTGFIIEGNRILTNAHVVSMANTIRVSRANQRKDYDAKILFIAHDCDLALLSVEDDEFFANSKPIPIGDVPELNSPVVVIGFPIGGDRVSITRGVVSRKEMDVYSHSSVDSHLTIQVDAAINPGNSGGPALQDDKLIGVAFQVHRGGENLGYLIPTVIVNRFLDDVKDNSYDGYIEFGAITVPTVNPVMKRALNVESHLKPPDTGVMVIDTLAGSSSDGFLKKGDILSEINGHVISQYGDVEIGGNQVSYTELVDNLSAGTKINVKILRDGKFLGVTFPARATDIIDFQRNNYDTPPRMRLTGGLLFQPLDADLMNAYIKDWQSAGRTEILYHYGYHLAHHLYESKKEYVIFTRKLNDQVNLYADKYMHRIVDRLNGETVTDFESFNRLLDRALAGSEYISIEFINDSAPLIMKTEDINQSRERILKKYSIRHDRYPEQKGGLK